MEQTTCFLCKENKTKIKYRKEGFTIVECLNDKHLFVNPRLTEKELAERYNAHQLSPMEYYKENVAQDRELCHRKLKIVQKFKQQGTALDIGCNIGTCMDVFKQAGWNIEGIEINKAAAEYAQEKGHKIYTQPLEKLHLKKEGYDLILLNDVLEHIPDPQQVFEQIEKLLKFKGIILIATPNRASVIAKISGKHWLHLKPDEHLHYFTKRELIDLLKRNRLHTIYQGTVKRTRNVETILKKAESYSRIPYRIIKILHLDKALKRIRVSINLHDEMELVAQKQ